MTEHFGLLACIPHLSRQQGSNLYADCAALITGANNMGQSTGPASKYGGFWRIIRNRTEEDKLTWAIHK
eukprot:3337303-Pyramimonas_sp.AAC.1